MKCPRCHKKIKKGSSVCDQCGASVPESASAEKCSCGATLRKGAAFCNQCGKSAKPPHPWRKVVAILLTATILFGAVGVLGWQLGWFSWIGGSGAATEEPFEPKSVASASLRSDVQVFGEDDTNAIENAVISSTQEGDRLTLEMSSGSPLASLTSGDVFVLKGFTDSAFGETYFGKVAYISNYGDTVYVTIQTPSVYEVFDDMDMDILQSLDYSTLSDFEAVDGVTVCAPDAVLQAEENGMGIEQLSSGGYDPVDETADSNGIGLTLEIDLLKLLEEFGKSDSDTSSFYETSETEAKFVTVYYTDTGVCYHTDDCRYLHSSKNETTLDKAAGMGLRPCTVCKPYYINDEEHKFASIDKELKLTGSVKLTDLSFGVVGKNGKKWEFEQGFEDLSVQTGGTLKANVKLEGNCSLKFEGETTSLTVKGLLDKPFLTIEGLKEKMLPFAYCTWNGATFQITDVPDDDDPWNAPVSIGVLFYTDLYGNISFGLEFNCEYTKPITKSFDIYKDGKFLGIGAEKDVVSENAEDDPAKKLTWGIKAEIAADVTFEALGASVMLYVGNVNLLELNVATLAANVKGAVGFDSAKLDNDTYGFYAEGDARIYLEMFKLKMKASVEGFGGILDLEADCTLGPLINLNIWQLNKQTERDIVLVLDASGSMQGTPIQEARNAAINFINTVMDSKEDVSVGIVTYANSASIHSPLTCNKDTLLQAVDQIYASGGTNIDEGLSRAEEMLNARDAKKKSIVLLSDGLPNDGRVGESLIEYSNTIKDQDVYIYTLGFFTALSGSDKVEAQSLMKALATEGMHYEVSTADDLVFFFGDLADQISGQKYIYIRIACPVDVTVKYDGERLCSKESKLNTRTEFGTLTFEENEDEDADEDSDNRIKILRLKEGAEYEILIEGNGRGRMNYTIGFMDEEGEYSDMREFRNIKITKRTEISTVASRSESTYLYVDEDGDGKRDLTYKAAVDSRAQLVEESNVAIILIVIAVVAVTVGGTGTLIILRVRKNKRKKSGIRP